MKFGGQRINFGLIFPLKEILTFSNYRATSLLRTSVHIIMNKHDGGGIIQDRAVGQSGRGKRDI